MGAPVSSWARARSGTDQQSFELVDRLGAGLDRGRLGQFEQPDHLARPGAGLRDRANASGQHRLGSGLGLQDIDLAAPAPFSFVGMVDLDDLQPGGVQVTGHARAEAVAALDPARDTNAALPAQGQH